jgi:hypothetical protein
MTGETKMNRLQTSTIEKISFLSDDQLSILDAIIDEFLRVSGKSETVKRVGVGKGKISFPDDFDNIDFGTPEFFGFE